MSKREIELATDYVKVLASGGDVTQTDWYRLIDTVNKKKGTGLNPYDEAKSLGITFPRGTQKPLKYRLETKPMKSIFDTKPIKVKADLLKKPPKGTQKPLRDIYQTKPMKSIFDTKPKKGKVGGEE